MASLKSRRRTILVAIALFFCVGAATSCTPDQIALWNTLTHEQQLAVGDAIHRENSAGGDCFSALGHFSGPHAKARQVIMRESGNNPSAANRSSSARGCWQTMMSIHGPKYYQVGCTPDDWDNPVCNTKVADILYRSSGWSPWAASGG